MGKLDGTIALVTGGNSGIGLATAKQFVNEGAYVFITGRREAELTAAVKEIGRNVSGVQGDVSNLADLDRLFDQIKQEKGKLDIVFANAGVARYAALGAFQGPEDFLFHKDDGSPLDPDVFRNDVLYPALKQLGIPILRRGSGFHMFRHTAASLINKETGNMKLSQAQLGHANVQITADVYTHVDEAQRRKAAEALERGILGNL